MAKYARIRVLLPFIPYLVGLPKDVSIKRIVEDVALPPDAVWVMLEGDGLPDSCNVCEGGEVIELTPKVTNTSDVQQKFDDLQQELQWSWE